MRPILFALLGLLATGPLRAAPPEDARALYARFVAAQNAHDFDAVRATLLDDDRFLWITNGLALRGPEAAIARMRGFHGNAVWRIDPVWARAQAIEPGPGTVVLHVPLVLTVGRAAAPDRYRILVSALCVEGAGGWRIAALFTTDANPDGWVD